MGKDESGFISVIRRLVSLMGILFTLWCLLIYIAYWFDRINNFIDLDLVGILTFGRLKVSDTEEECTFSIKALAKTDTRTVNHRAILFICLMGIAFGVLIISGGLYKVLSAFVNKVLSFVH